MIIKNLKVTVSNRTILQDLNLIVNDIDVIMGPNGSGKSTLSRVIAGDSGYEVLGSIEIDGQNILQYDVDERVNRFGIFLSFQLPPYLEGITLKQLLKKIFYKRRGYDERDLTKIREFNQELNRWMDVLGLSNEFLDREVNKDLSGGEKKKSETLQLLMFKPKYIILDEIDSGLDVDSLKRITDAINIYYSENKPKILLITHYNRILRYIKPTAVHIMKSGKIVRSGGVELIDFVESHGYDPF
ncbi:MAG: Fe-S cluster assembly ATPase SufC [Candidatus Anstonellales archaeon]